MNGLTLRADYGPYIVTAISPTQHFYTDTGLSAAVTLPATITSTTTWYCAPAYSDFYTFTCTQLDGSDISPGVPQWVGTTADSTLNPRPSLAQVAADVEPFARLRKVISGCYVGPYASDGPGTTAAGTGVLTMVPFWCPHPFTADRIACEVTATAANAVVRLGIYLPDSNDRPATLALDAGTVDAHTATGELAATIDYGFVRGLYWLAAVSQTASATLRTVGNGGLAPVQGTGTGTTVGFNTYYRTGITGALADVSSPTASGAGYKVMVRSA